MVKQRLAFSLLETLVAMTIFGLITAGLASFTYISIHSMFTSEQKLIINRNIRDVTNEMIINARQANYFVLYDNFEAGMRSATTAEEAVPYYRQDGQTGDFLLLVYYGVDPAPADNQPPPIERLVGYYRSPDEDENKGPVYKFDIDIPSSQQDDLLESLIPPTSEKKNHEIIVQLSEGLANGQLFFNLERKSIMVNAQFYSGNEAKWVTDTYNFTISPRS